MSGLIDSLCERYSGDYRQMAVALDAALAEIDRLRLEVANLRTENRELRRMLRDHELRMLRRAERDALLLGALHFSGGYTSKRHVSTVGMGENRWCLARALLRFGGAISKRTGAIKAETPAQWEASVSSGVRIVAAEGIDLLKRASYRHRRKSGALSGALSGAHLGTNARQYTGEMGAA